MNNNDIKIKGCMRPNDNMNLFLDYEKELKEVLKNDETRYWHSISVALTAVSLGEVYKADKDECLTAGLLHDYCKYMSYDKMLEECERYNVLLSEEDKNADGCIHGFLAAKLCKEKFGINDDIANAIYYHTCGKPNMNILEKIIYIADFIEPLRRFRDKVCDIRELCFNGNIDKAIVKTAEMNLEFLKRQNKYIHTNTIKTLEYYKSITS